VVGVAGVAQENACPHGGAGRGYGRDGGLASHVLVDGPRALLPLGTLDPGVAGPLTDAGATSFHAVRRCLPHLDPASVVIVIGVGGLGSFVVQILRATTQARIVAIDPDPARRVLARGWGAHEVFEGFDGSHGAQDAMGDLPAGYHVDAVIDLVGTDATIAAGLRVLGPGGAFALVGAAHGTLRRPWYPTLPRDGQVFTFQGSDLGDARAVIELAVAGAIEVPVVPFALTEVADAYAALAAGTLVGRAVVRP
jgi:propanol-preferring alcohol dehydrogenase